MVDSDCEQNSRKTKNEIEKWAGDRSFSVRLLNRV
jgi:hypothetical protein